MATATKVRRSNSSKCKALSDDVKKAIRSDYMISSVSKCVEELVYNSIDAGCGDIQIEVDLSAFRIKVQDNGSGVSLKDLEKIGTRFVTSKIKSREDLVTNARPEYYGYRGESLASLIELSERVEIISKYEESKDGFMFSRKFVDGKSSGPAKSKENKFTTSGFVVFVSNFMARQPVRQKRINTSLQMEEIKAFITALSLIHHNIHFTVRDLETSAVILKVQKKKEPTQEFVNLCRSKAIMGNNFTVLDSHAHTLGYYIDVAFCTQGSKQRCLQYLFVNKRPVINSRVCKLLSNSLAELLGFSNRKNQSGDSQWQVGKEAGGHRGGNELYPMFLLKISCPISEYFLIAEGNKCKVEFQNKHNIDGALDVAATTARTKIANFMAEHGDRKWKPSNSFGTYRQRSDVTGEEILKEIKSKASIHDMRSALVSQPAYRVRPEESHTNRVNLSRRKKKDVSTPSSDDSDSSVNEVFSSQELREPGISEGRLSVLKPISSYANATAARHLPKKGPFGKMCERTIDTAGLRKRKKMKEASAHEAKKTKLSVEPSNDGVEAWLLARDKARKDGAARNRVMSSSSPEIIQRNTKRAVEVDSDTESIISHTLSRLSVTPRGPATKDSNEVPMKKGRKLNVLEEHRTLTLEANKKLKIPDAGSSMRSKIQETVKNNSKAISQINVQIQALCGNSSSSTKSFPGVSETPAIYHEFSRHSQPFSQPFGSHNVSKLFDDEEHNTSDEMEVMFASQKSRMSDGMGQNLAEGYSNLSDVRQRDPRVRARHAETKHKRNAIHFGSQEGNCGSMVGFRNSQQMDGDFSQESRLLPQTNRLHRSSQESRNQVETNFMTRENTYTLSPVREGLYVGQSMDFVNHNSQGFNTENVGYAARALTSASDDAFLGRSPSDGDKNLFDMDYSESKEHMRNFAGHVTMSGTWYDLFHDNVVSPARSTCIKELETSRYFEPEQRSGGLDEVELTSHPSDKLPEIIPDKSESWSPAAEIFLPEHNDPNIDLEKENIVAKLGNGMSCNGPLQKTKNFRNQWLKKTFPETCSSYWNIEEARTTNGDPVGDVNKVVSNPESLLGNTLKACLNRIHEDDAGSKWRNGVPDIDNCVADTIRLPPPVTAPIQDLQKQNAGQRKIDDTSFTWRMKKEEMKKIVLIGNVDNKFIFAKVLAQVQESCSTVLVLFDQHAVHERIRLENLIADVYDPETKFGSVRALKCRDLLEKITMEFPESDVSIMSNFIPEFNKNGLYFEVLDSKHIQLSRIPTCFDYRLTEFTASQEAVLCEHYVRMMIQEIVQDIISTNGGRPDILPKTVMEQLKSQACRGAIKFGDELSLEQSSSLLDDLQKCDMPFQCAHGRPTLYPVLELVD